jgi:hypothetical protein
MGIAFLKKPALEFEFKRLIGDDFLIGYFLLRELEVGDQSFYNQVLNRPCFWKDIYVFNYSELRMRDYTSGLFRLGLPVRLPEEYCISPPV